MKEAPRAEDTRPRLSPLAVPQGHADTLLLPGESEARSQAAVPARRGRLSHCKVGIVMNQQEDTVAEETNMNSAGVNNTHPPSPPTRAGTEGRRVDLAQPLQLRKHS